MKTIQFEVPGGGVIQMSKSPHSMCGGAVGFSFGVSWGRNGFSGGVLGRGEAKRMAEFILLEISKCDESEDNERKRIYKEMLLQ